ncbi:NAD(P)-binding domain-containing protein [Dermatophilus congolensis]|uniref:NAD(P)-binding domain-containing protein n=9 Tax=Dermatophilus congolensis TaxID=1863 RepID=UPI001AAFC73E|nr:NAD(P)-binding domain-containing protein [Dermatophilus congolensis]MBO3130683.1 hypothetical protein [Dermatophilus congolensis]MBO3135156.1 hypothetical protein [Dermatophilus congolensis]MBO3137395.1 hypothetical protein [Dermatophilus congolensis]MBO3139636.1 hypothetical protein [Dermatophilus congolensis]MBO3141876.1 hypothetical protein [Dermatophilus congolensis]
MDRPARLAVGVVGMGRVGMVLGRALDQAGHTVGFVAPWQEDGCDEGLAGQWVPDAPVVDPVTAAASADLLLLAVPDERLPALVEHLVINGGFRPGQIVLHTGFTAGVSLMDQVVSEQILPVCVEPLVTFVGNSADVERFRGSPVLVSCLPELRPVGEALVIEMGAEPSFVAPDEVVRVRAALSYVEASLDAVVSGAKEMLSATGVDAVPHVLGVVLAGRADAMRRGEQPAARGALHGEEVVSADLRELGVVLGPVGQEVHVAAMRALVASAVFEGRLPAAGMAEILDVLHRPRSEGASE